MTYFLHDKNVPLEKMTLRIQAGRGQSPAYLKSSMKLPLPGSVSHTEVELMRAHQLQIHPSIFDMIIELKFCKPHCCLTSQPTNEAGDRERMLGREC